MYNDSEKLQVVKIIRKTKYKVIMLLKGKNKKIIYKRLLTKDSLFDKMLQNEVKLCLFLKSVDIAPQIHFYSPSKRFVMFDYIDGFSLKEKNFTDDLDVILVMIKVLECVETFHQKGIVHCDLKPSNIMIDSYGKVKIIDLEISLLNSNKSLNYYTLEYCSYEQLKKLPLNFQTDIYSLGIILYELLFKELPFGTDKKKIIKNKIIGNYKKVTNPKLNSIFKKCFSNDLDIRYKTVKELEKDIIEYKKTINRL